VEPIRAQPLHRLPEGADAGQDHPLGLAQRVVVVGDLRLRAQRGKGALDRAQVAHAVVDDRYHSAACAGSAGSVGCSGPIFIRTSPFSSRTILPFSSVKKIALLVKASSVS